MSLTPLSVYIHWPFCKRKCPYCDFNSHVADAQDAARWAAAYKAELTHLAHYYPNHNVRTLYIGGGTPSLMPPVLVESLLANISDNFDMGSDVEITLEANPTSVEAAKLADFKAAGVNRLSMGIQALNDADLKFLGREHSVTEAKKAWEAATNLFDRATFDLIYARKGQTLEAWRSELSEAISMAKGHLSLYQLTIEKGTEFYRQANQGATLTSDDSVATAMYELTQEMMEKAGMPAYEISNHAATGQESRHNMAYWCFGEYLGLGPGAHGRYHSGDNRHATMTIHEPARWLEAVEQHGHGIQTQEVLDDDALLSEMLMLCLRVEQGLTSDIISNPADLFDKTKLEYLANEGLIAFSDTQLTATPKGRRVLHAVIEYLLEAGRGGVDNFKPVFGNFNHG